MNNHGSSKSPNEQCNHSHALSSIWISSHSTSLLFLDYLVDFHIHVIIHQLIIAFITQVQSLSETVPRSRRVKTTCRLIED